MTLRTAEPLSYARAVASSPEIIDHYYDLLEQTLVDNDLLEKPMQLFNMDETAMPLDPTPTKVVVLKGTKYPTSVTSGNKAQITVVACCNAAGYAMPPMVVFDHQTLKPEMAFGEVPATVYGLSKKGWMDSELFQLWFTQHFLVHAPPTRPLLLLMDGHSTHFEPSVIRKAAEVILFCLPPHTTHLLQPLDKGCFGPLKVCWRRECQAYLRRNPGKVMTRFEFSRVFSQAWFQGMSMSSVIGGFRTTGVYLFDRHALQPATNTPTRFNPASLCNRTGLKFIPLYSPARQRTCGVTSSPCVPLSSPSTNDAQSTDNDESRPVTPSRESQHQHLPQLKRMTMLSKSLSSLPTVSALKYYEIEPKSSARVLTSTENLRNMEEKQRKKEEEERKKKERQVERMVKCAEKEKLEASKKALRQKGKEKKHAEKEDSRDQATRTIQAYITGEVC